MLLKITDVKNQTEQGKEMFMVLERPYCTESKSIYVVNALKRRCRVRTFQIAPSFTWSKSTTWKCQVRKEKEEWTKIKKNRGRERWSRHRKWSTIVQKAKCIYHVYHMGLSSEQFSLSPSPKAGGEGCTKKAHVLWSHPMLMQFVSKRSWIRFKHIPKHLPYSIVLRV